MITYHKFTKKEMQKDYKALILLHKRCIKTYLIGKGLKFRSRHSFFIIYDYYIDTDNISRYFNLPVKYFVYSLIKYKLKNLDNGN